MADDRRAGDRYIASDYWDRDRDRDCPLATRQRRAVFLRRHAGRIERVAP
jgi:hypothetical protein